MSPKILIVGAGPTGLSLACLLLEAGIPCKIIEKRNKMSSMTRAIGINHAGMQVLDRLNLLNIILKKGIVVNEILVYWNKKRIASLKHRALDMPYRFFLYCPQPIVEKYLCKRLRQFGGYIEREVEFESFVHAKENITVVLKDRKDGRQVEDFNIVVGCDGGRSLIREKLLIDSDIEHYQAGFLVADMQLRENLQKARYYLDEFGYIMLLPLPRHSCRIVFSFQGVCKANFHQNIQVEDFIQEQCKNRVGEVLPILKLTWIASGPLRHQVACRAVSGQIILMGDALHMFSPVGGTNMNMGLQDAMSFVDKLVSHKNGKETCAALQEYERERRAAIETNLLKTKTISYLMLRSECRNKSLEEKFLPLYRNRQFIKFMMPEFFSGMTLDDKSPLFALLKG